MDLSEMKSILAKQQQQMQAAVNAAGGSANPMNLHASANSSLAAGTHPPGGGGRGKGGSSASSGAAAIDSSGAGYVTEKLYMLLQLYLQNKGWNPSAELLQCFAELKDSPLLPNAAYLQVLATRLALDGQGRLVLRDNGKIVLPFEHFANAVMLKHMSGPHGLHLSLEATMRAVIDSYTIGRENFGMEKEFIIEVVNSCPNPACRYYKSHMGHPFDVSSSPGVSQGGSGGSGAGGNGSGGGGGSGGTPNAGSGNNISIDLTTSEMAKSSSQLLKQQQQQLNHHQQQQQQQQQLKNQQHLSNVILQQQNRVLAAQQSLEKFNNLSALEKQRMLAAMCPPNANPTGPTNNPLSRTSSLVQQQQQQQQNQQRQELQLQQQMLLNLTNQAQHLQGAPSNLVLEAHSHKINEYLRSNNINNSLDVTASPGTGTITPNMETIAANKDLLALHNGAWGNGNTNNSSSSGGGSTTTGSSNISNNINNNNSNANNAVGSMAEYRDGVFVGQDKIVRVFTELMRNMAKMKTFIRPSMCKPYGKQSESLQKSLMDTIQLVQSLRNCLPAPHIPVSSWKSEDRHRRDPSDVVGSYEGC